MISRSESNVNVVAEVGINHNGSVELAKDLIKEAYLAGCDYVKIQKRNPETCVPEAQKQKPRWTPRQGQTTYIDYKKEIEFDRSELDEVFGFAENLGIGAFSSAWDPESAKLLADVGCDIGKLPSALITDKELLKACRREFEFLIMSTGMSTEQEIERAVDAADPDVLMHSVSSYPSDISELNLRYIKHLREKFGVPVGYSGHELPIHTASAAVAFGSTWIERHVTLNSQAWGSDQTASLEPDELSELVRVVRETEQALGPPGVGKVSYDRDVLDSEKAKRKSLRGQ